MIAFAQFARQVLHVAELVRLKPRRASAAAKFNLPAYRFKNSVQPGQHARWAVENGGKCPGKKILEKGRINLRAAVELRANIIQINSISQGILGDDVNVPPVKVLVLYRLAIVRN